LEGGKVFKGADKIFITEQDSAAKDFYPITAKPVSNLPGFENLASFLIRSENYILDLFFAPQLQDKMTH
jgi:hypothetical protein